MSDDSTDFNLPEDAIDYVDIGTFEQILEMDDGDPDREFSKGLVAGFFDQAETTFDQMVDCLEKKDLPQLSSLGHFLKGSSATLGIAKVRDSCEKIQHWGQLKDGEGDKPIEEKEALANIADILPKMKADYDAAEKWLKVYFDLEDESAED